MYTLNFTRTMKANPDAVWQILTDMPRYPEWDPREAETRLDGPFAAGVTGWSKQHGNPGGPFTITEVVPGERFTGEPGMPLGKLVIVNRIEPLADGTVRVGKQYTVSGPMTLLFRLYFARKIRQSMPAHFDALEQEVNRVVEAAA
jgi:hypothetical protein